MKGMGWGCPPKKRTYSLYDFNSYHCTDQVLMQCLCRGITPQKYHTLFIHDHHRSILARGYEWRQQSILNMQMKVTVNVDNYTYCQQVCAAAVASRKLTALFQSIGQLSR
uniref:Uncharacterized protein n=1 Tax=Anguilla anguilla TaxID=7936 RepID=A0A0E9TFD9_ANGAN